MPRLIVLNGPPAAGKSTIAARYVDEHPGTLNLDIDRWRRFVGGWRDDPAGANLLAREVALAAAGAHLRGGHDVLVPAYLGRLDYLDRLGALAVEVGATLHEFVLMDSKDRMLARFAERTQAAADPGHVEAALALERAGGTGQLEAMYDRLLLVIAARPDGRLLPARAGEIEQTYADLLARLTP